MKAYLISDEFEGQVVAVVLASSEQEAKDYYVRKNLEAAEDDLSVIEKPLYSAPIPISGKVDKGGKGSDHKTGSYSSGRRKA